LYAQSEPNQAAVVERKAAETPKESKEAVPKTSFVKTADFYLRDGKFVLGKLISEDKNKIVIEQLNGSEICVTTYGNKEVDTRTIHTKSVPEYQYYIDLAEYFTGRTWDFRDDPDDFIQAIRCYEKAKELLSETQKTGGKIEQIDKEIGHLQADRNVWVKEMESRAKLKKLEFEATIETRLKQLEGRVDAVSQQFDKSMADVNDNYRQINESISALNKDISRQLNSLAERTEINKRRIDYIEYYIRNWRPWPHGSQGPDFDSNSVPRGKK
jgi:hypothetical protein